MYRRFLSLRYMRSRLVNYLSIGAVTVGVAVMIVVTSVADGFQDEVRTMLRGLSSHLAFEPTGGVVFDDGREPADPPFAEVEATMRRDPDVVAVTSEISTYVAHPWVTGQRSRTTNFHLVQAIGIDWAREIGLFPAPIPDPVPPGGLVGWVASMGDRAASPLGRSLLALKRPDPFDDPEARYRDYVSGVFGLSFLERFVPSPDGSPASYLGKRVEFVVYSERRDASGEVRYERGTRQIVVGGVYESQSRETDVQRIFLSIPDLRAMAAIGPEYQQVRVALRDFRRAEEVRDRLLAATAMTDPKTGARLDPFAGRTWEEFNPAMIRALGGEKQMLLIILSFIVILACFTILATLTLTVVEKTKDIGVIRALGATRTGVLAIFLRSGMLIGAIGASLGLVLGVLAANHVNGIRDFLAAIGVDVLNPETSLLRRLPSRIDPQQIAVIAIGSVFVSFLAALFPALRASRLVPVVALRHE